MKGLKTLVNIKETLLAKDFGNMADRVESECIISADSEARDGAISEDNNGSDGVGVTLDLSHNIPLVEGQLTLVCRRCEP